MIKKSECSRFFPFPWYNFNNQGNQIFKPLTLVPTQTKIIDKNYEKARKGEVREGEWERGMMSLLYLSLLKTFQSVSCLKVKTASLFFVGPPATGMCVFGSVSAGGLLDVVERSYTGTWLPSEQE